MCQCVNIFELLTTDPQQMLTEPISQLENQHHKLPLVISFMIVRFSIMTKPDRIEEREFKEDKK